MRTSRHAGPRQATVVTAGHLSTCPRMVKAADALHDAGYGVHVISTSHTPWAARADDSVLRTRGWTSTVVDYRADSARARQVASGARRRVAESISRRLGAANVPLPIATRAYSRIHDELVRAIVSRPADFVYAGTTGALAAAAEAAARLGVPYALDLEDFHSGEHPDGDVANALAERIESEVLGNAAFLTAASPMIADEYARKYSVRPRTIHNTFPINFRAESDAADTGVLRGYWFSQTIGAGRGLDDVVRAFGAAEVPAELHVRGRAVEEFIESLEALRRREAPRLVLRLHEPAPPDDMVPLAHGYDIGFSSELTEVVNRRLCLSNKIFTYLAAGLPVALSRTPAQERLASTLGGAAFLYDAADPQSLAVHLQLLARDADRRASARAAARAASLARWHWEHPEDRGTLLQLASVVLGAAA